MHLNWRTEFEAKGHGAIAVSHPNLVNIPNGYINFSSAQFSGSSQRRNFLTKKPSLRNKSSGTELQPFSYLNSYVVCWLDRNSFSLKMAKWHPCIQFWQITSCIDAPFCFQAKFVRWPDAQDFTGVRMRTSSKRVFLGARVTATVFSSGATDISRFLISALVLKATFV